MGAPGFRPGRGLPGPDAVKPNGATFAEWQAVRNAARPGAGE